MELQTVANSELCPKCGNLVSELNELTGWCAPCSIHLVCPNCGREYKRGAHCLYCSSVKVRYRDRIADLREEGHSASEALKIVRDEIRPLCAICGQPMTRARKESVICRQTAVCRKAYNKFRNKQRRGIPNDIALQETLREIND
jgi:DNA-directed RNA polymerase subunit M/transcription elongation factor TFIIS